ncbi:SMI1/KNR4 family protein [Brevibacillus sp. SYSU BS000544]|uniref:SMI1/KNR4 family protein n=1 Tax=Brevibacillus sp. SYSU BS000544 TaxID=3416443 RepID=UPI003CE521A8
MKERLEKYYTWVEQNFPHLKDCLNKGATAEEISELEQTLGFSLPEDYREFLRIHNGQKSHQETGVEGLLGGWTLLSIKDVIQTWEDWNSLQRDFEIGGVEFEITSQGHVKPMMWNRHWVPFLVRDGSSLYCIDADPADNGKVGQIILFDHDGDTRKVFADNFTMWFEAFLSTVEEGHYKVYKIDSNEMYFETKLISY